MRRRIYAVVIVAFVLLCTGVWSNAVVDASAANKKQEVRSVADSSEMSAGFTAGYSSSSGNEINLRLDRKQRFGRKPALGC